MTQSSPADRAAEKARSLIGVKRNQAAAEAAIDGLRDEPDNAHLMGLLAMALDRDGQSKEARQWAERSLGIDPQQAWVYDIRAEAILGGAGHPQEAVASARKAVKLDPLDGHYRYTLARAFLEVGDRDEAGTIARSIRRVDPNSALGPLAEALVAIQQVRTLEVRRWPLVVLVVFVTRGGVLIPLAIWWLWVFVRRIRPLRTADRLLLEALKLDPTSVTAHAIAAEVAQLRFRYVQSVDSTLATAALAAGLVDADELARRITRRTSWVVAAAFVGWIVCTLILRQLIVDGSLSQHVAGIVDAVVGLAMIAFTHWLDGAQTRRLPAGLLRRVRRRWGLPVTTSVVAALVLWWGSAFAGLSDGLAAAGALCGSIAAVYSAVLFVKLYFARRLR